MRDSSSLLHWMQRMLQVRKQHALFGIGTFEVVHAENPSVLAFVREHDDDVVLCVNNLSRFAQPVELPLQRFEGRTPIELLGRVPFPRIGELPYLLTLSTYGFFWFQLVETP
jgi:maltose alpha-D-glucosyltransferase/alpha-amylase